MANSLIGKADGTIVNAAYRAAIANVPKDNLESLKITREAYKSTLDTVEGIFKSMQEKHEADNAELEGYLSDLKDEAASGTHKSVITDQVTDALNSFRQEYKKIPKGPKGEKQRLEWRSRVNKYTNSLKNESENLSLASEYFLNNGVNTSATGEKGGLEFFNAVMKYRKGEEGHGVTRSSDTDGNIFYTYNGQKMSMNEMMKLIVPKHIESQNASLTVEEKLTTQGLKGVNELDRDLIYDTIAPTLNSKDALHDFVYTKRGKEGRSIAQEIQSLDGPYTNEIFSALNERGLFKELDIGGEEGLDVTDFQGQNAGKYKAVADHILKGNNFDMSKKMVLDIYSSTVGQKALDRGIKAYNIKNSNLGSGFSGEEGTGFLTTKKGINSGTLGYYIFPNYDSAKFAYDQFNAASQGKEAKFSIGKAQYVFDIKGDNAYKWIEKRGDGSQRVVGTTTETIGPDGFGIADSDFLKIKDFEGGNTKEIKEFEGLGAGSANNKNLHKTLFNKLDLNDDDDVSKNLNDYFGLGRRSKLNFMPFALASEKSLSNKGGAGGIGFGKADTAYTNDIMLYNPQTGEVIKDEDGNRMRFKIGDDIKSLDENTGLSEDVAKILEILNQYDIKTPKQKGETSVTKAEVDNMIQKYLPKQN